MSHFSSVDDSPDPTALVASLDISAGWLGAMKSYVATTLARAVPSGLVLDLGCGAGHDLSLLADAGLRPVGVDPSWAMVSESSARTPTARVIQADGVTLPFGSGSFDGCRIERVLQHVEAPERVLAEVARVLRFDGKLAVFEPDWSSWRIDSEIVGAERLAAELPNVRQPAIGRRLPELVEQAGFRITDVVTEASVVSRIDRMPVGLESGLDREVRAGRVHGDLAERWLAEQRGRDEAGRFRLRQSKVLVLARRMAHGMGP